ncbi:relaxase/mobilization nuclease domain-containing protein [Streptomonospora nanhaiensis]|uniref:relaxase/mobilization nuclease domain-containing protein n=1 Tax=Streptomonospora nanhaiensis TaxID=1323731 RepID=UPI001C99091C|nr:relaxase/mobilization nuclease domain-containing protein [Streptomonospora nanhaiensis]MBX9387402.1 relaxase/mobilization nuclease domain-containing protein [Streptomonospora nanhaiensis]
MIAKVMRGSDTYGLLRYLYGPGRANEHIDPHLVGAWRPLGVPDPGRSPDAALPTLARRLDQFVAPDTRTRHVWHCAVRVAHDDRPLTDPEWNTVARRIAAAGGVAPHGDPRGCRWIAVRHDGTESHHIHLVATLKRQDDTRPDIHNDALRLRDECRALEHHLGLRTTGPSNGTSDRLPKRGEVEKALRRGRSEPARVLLAREVRTAAVAAHSEDEFFAALRDEGVLVHRRTDGAELVGYAVALPDDRNDTGEPVWLSGSTLAPELSLPRLRRRFAAAAPPEPGIGAARAWARLRRCLDEARQRTPGDTMGRRAETAAALSDAFTAVAAAAPRPLRPGLRAAADAWQQAGRLPCPTQQHPHAARLRDAARTLIRTDGTPDTQDLRGVLDLLDALAADLAEWYTAQRWAPQRHRAELTRTHLAAVALDDPCAETG